MGGPKTKYGKGKGGKTETGFSSCEKCQFQFIVVFRLIYRGAQHVTAAFFISGVCIYTRPNSNHCPALPIPIRSPLTSATSTKR